MDVDGSWQSSSVPKMLPFSWFFLCVRKFFCIIYRYTFPVAFVLPFTLRCPQYTYTLRANKFLMYSSWNYERTQTVKLLKNTTYLLWFPQTFNVQDSLLLNLRIQWRKKIKHVFYSCEIYSLVRFANEIIKYNKSLMEEI